VISTGELITIIWWYTCICQDQSDQYRWVIKTYISDLVLTTSGTLKVKRLECQMIKKIWEQNTWKLTLTGIPYVHKINVNLICYWATQLFRTLLVTCGRSVVFSGYSGSSTNKTDHHDITEILMKVALYTIGVYSNIK
jgi:hypothetical protein